MQRKVGEIIEFSSIFVIKIPSFLTFLCHNFLSCSNVDKLLYFIGIASSRLSVRMELGSHWADSHEI